MAYGKGNGRRHAASADGADYSLGYVATWASRDGTDARTALKQSAQRIQKAADAILAGIAPASAETRAVAA